MLHILLVRVCAHYYMYVQALGVNTLPTHTHTCSKHLPDDWLERMYHSCQHRRPAIPESPDNPELHPLLMAHLVSRLSILMLHGYN